MPAPYLLTCPLRSPDLDCPLQWTDAVVALDLMTPHDRLRREPACIANCSLGN
jgi:hypothetical protein